MRSRSLNLPALRRNRAAQMTAGLILVGAAGYYLLAVSGRNLSADEAAAVATLYLVANIIGPGIATAIEQETTRVVSLELARGQSPTGVIRRMAIFTGAIVAAATILLFCVAPAVVSKALHGHWDLLLSLALAISSFCGLYLLRGVLSGRQQFGAYAVTLAVEGGARLLPLFLLAQAGAVTAARIGLIFAAGPLVAVASGSWWLRRGAPTADTSDHGDRTGRGHVLFRSLAMLLGGSFLLQAIANLAPVLAAARLASSPEIAVSVATAFVLARIPLFLFVPVQAMLLPQLVRAAAHSGERAMMRIVGKGLAIAGGLGAVGIIALWAAGRLVLARFFGVDWRLSPWLLAAIGLGTAVLMGAQLLQAALLAVGCHGRLLAGWACGLATLVLVALMPVEPVTAAVAAQVLAPAVVASLAAARLMVRSTRREAVAEA